MTTVFNLAAANLEPGVTLIEASAGTGKTFSLAGLILRLILEGHVPVNKILAVTYTVAATKELKDRVRSRLHEAIEDLRRGKTEDEILARFIKQGDFEKNIRELDLALQSFDEAQIFTIHGFCQRILHDHAFESGTSFETELVTDPTPLFEQVAKDFWRLKFYDAAPLVPALMIAWQQSPDAWVKLLDRMRNHPDVLFIPPPTKKSFDQLATDIEKSFEAMRAEWKANSAKIERILQTDGNLSRGKASFSSERIQELLENIAEACGDFDCANPPCIKALAGVTTEAIAAGTKPTGTAPAHRFFEECSVFSKLVEELFLHLTFDFLQYAKTELPKRKSRAGIVTFEDLVLRLRDALVGSGGKKLAAAVGEKYRAVLVDEFQDTDPAQYEIFRQVFDTGRHRLFYIGDPKQAIYGFRGADIFTYLEAASKADRIFTLQTNWRSEKKLVEAINQLFQQVETPFFLSGIRYHEVRAAEEAKLPILNIPSPPGFAAEDASQPPSPRLRRAKKDQERRTEDKENGRANAEHRTSNAEPHATGQRAAGSLRAAERSPLQFRFVQSSRDDGRSMNQAEATAAICEAVKDDIVKFKGGGARLGERDIGFGDMTVLVRRNTQADQMQEVLRAHGIPSVVQSERSVFLSGEARDLQQLLQGILEPRREPLFKAALTTHLIGLNGSDLIALDDNEAARQQWLDRFAEWQTKWVDDCFIAVFRHIMVQQNVRARVVRLPGGERRLTNFLHLAELLHEAESAERLQPDGLCAWLNRERNKKTIAHDEFQLRLESDADAVQIVTIHKCKGLQYPIVYCPFLWLPAESSKRDELQFHDRKNKDRLTVSLRGKAAGNDEQRAWQTEEIISEEVRMLYVAVTRARNRCTIYFGDIKKIAQSPLAHLFGQPDNLLDAITTFAEQSNGNAATSVVSEAPGEVAALPPMRPASFRARNFGATIDRTAMVASFSGLNAGRIELQELQPEVSDEPEAVLPEKSTTGDTIFDFARGARAGDFFHAVLEKLDFKNPDGFEELVETQLSYHGLTKTPCRAALLIKFRELLDVELSPGMLLKNIGQRDRLSELEFTYRLNRLDPKRLRQILQRCDGIPSSANGNLGRLRFDPVEGYMRGFIDLLIQCDGRFYIVDWKSNWLGSRPADYGEEGMREAMAEHNYFLQSHLYVLAADLLLQTRLQNYRYERDFAGVFYVFLRGVDPTNPALGVFKQTPSEQTIKLLRELAA
jgi:exodeoxyribonuclease V beta subunit